MGLEEDILKKIEDFNKKYPDFAQWKKEKVELINLFIIDNSISKEILDFYLMNTFLKGIEESKRIVKL